MNTFIYGFSLGFSLILAIGAQNAFVLKQGLKHEHVFLVCFICALSDAILILIGVSGFHLLVSEFPSIVTVARYGGATFLFVYGLLSFRTALLFRHNLRPSEFSSQNWQKAALTCLAFTWLNPHVYLDTVVLLGSISSQFENELVEFASGATSASFVFFFSLGYGAKLLKPVFEKPRAWQVLEVLIGLIMWGIAAKLLFM
ncbi:MAG: LysE/ArgO family amino acid transporter [Gammaproteobacteria bacterium]|nr:LysE/ArgO family amino acid transporter [Gammaproteobacteria bacterium]